MNRYSVEAQADGTHAVFNNGGFVKGGWASHDRAGALAYARELADADAEAGVPCANNITLTDTIDERLQKASADRRNKRIMTARRKIVGLLSRSALERLASYERPHLCDTATLKQNVMTLWPIAEIREEVERLYKDAEA